MKFNLKNVFLSVGMLVVAFAVVGLVSTHNAYAATITATGSGNWSSTTPDAPWPAGTVPATTDNVIIPTGDTVTLTASTTVADLTLNAATSHLVLNSGQTLTVTGAFASSGTTTNGVNGPGTLLLAGTTNLAGTLTSTTFPNVTIGKVDGSSTNTVTITGALAGVLDLTVSTGATLTNSTYTVGINGNLAVSGTFTAGSGVFTMNGTGKTIAGTASIPSLTISGTTQNNGTLTVGTALAGASALTNGSGATLLIGGSSGITGLVPAVAANTINYTGTAQTIHAPTTNPYWHLIFSGTGTNTISLPASVTAISGDLTLSGTAAVTTGAGVTVTGALTVGATASLINAAGLALVAPTTVVTGALTNNGTMTVATSLTGAGTLTNGTTGTLNIGTAAAASAPTLAHLVATSTGNVVAYTGAAPHCLVTTYDTLQFTGSGAVVCAVTTVADEVVTSGTVTWTTTSSISTAILTVGSGTTVTNDSGMTLVAPTVAIAGTLANSGTITAATSLSVAGALTNAGTMTIASVATSGGTVSNAGTMTITTFAGTLTGLTNTGTLYLTGTDAAASDIGTLTAVGTGNTINYNKAGNQTAKATTYYNLIFSGGSGTKTLAGANAVHYDMTIGSGVKANINNTITVSGGLKLGTTWQSASSWGFTGSSATHINTTYFVTGTGKVVNALSHSSATITTGSTYTPGASSGGTTTTTTTTTTPNYPIIPSTPSTVVVTCPQGHAFDTATGKACTNYTAAPSAPTVTVYNFGSKTLKNGSTGAAVMELQRFLNAKLNLGLVLDGKLGPKTIAVIKQWQKAHGLVGDGLVGPKTKALMNELSE